jgi:hypothetical protein
MAEVLEFPDTSPATSDDGPALAVPLYAPQIHKQPGVTQHRVELRV